MAEVACFCGCCFSFDGAAAACPKCGEVARLTAGPVTEPAGRSRSEHPVPVTNGDTQNGYVPDVPPERIGADVAQSDVALSGVAARGDRGLYRAAAGMSPGMSTVTARSPATPVPRRRAGESAR